MSSAGRALAWGTRLGVDMRYVKLQQGSRKRQRVWELARNVNRSSADVLALLKELGEFVSSPQSYLELPVIRRVYERLGLQSGFPETRLSLASRKVSVEPSAASHVGLSAPPARRRRLNNHPLLPVDGRDRAFVPAIREGHEDGAPVWSSSDPDEAWGRNLQQTDASPTFELSEWMLRGFSEVERDVWLAGGLRRGQAKVAAEARDHGLDAADLGRNLSGWTVAARLRRGEGGAAVARLLLGERTGSA